MKKLIIIMLITSLASLSAMDKPIQSPAQKEVKQPETRIAQLPAIGVQSLIARYVLEADTIDQAWQNIVRLLPLEISSVQFDWIAPLLMKKFKVSPAKI